MSAVYALVQEYKLRVIEDAIQAFGCERDEKKDRLDVLYKKF